MVKRKAKRLSAGEIEMLSILWDLGSKTIAEVHAALGRPLGYTTVQTKLNRLALKGVVKRTADRPARYEALLSQKEISANHLDILLDRVTGGSIVPLVAQLMNDRKLSERELNEIRQIIEQAEQQQNHEARQQ